jgi:hypothetical protein
MGRFHFCPLPGFCAAFLRRRMKALLQRLLPLVLMAVVFTGIVVVVLYLLEAYFLRRPVDSIHAMFIFFSATSVILRKEVCTDGRT